MTSVSPYATLTEACQILRLNRWTVAKLCKNGEIAGARRLGGVWRIPRESLLPTKGNGQ